MTTGQDESKRSNARPRIESGTWRLRILIGIPYVLCAVLIYLLWNHSTLGTLRTNVMDSDYKAFEKITGVMPFQIFKAEVLPNALVHPGYVIYGAIVQDFPADVLVKDGWTKVEDVDNTGGWNSVELSILGRINKDGVYTKNADHNSEMLIVHSPYGNDSFLGYMNYMVFVTATYSVAFK